MADNPRELSFHFEIGGRDHFLSLTTDVIARTPTEALQRLHSALGSPQMLDGKRVVLKVNRGRESRALVADPVIQVYRDYITEYHITAAYDTTTKQPVPRAQWGGTEEEEVDTSELHTQSTADTGPRKSGTGTGRIKIRQPRRNKNNKPARTR